MADSKSTPLMKGEATPLKGAEAGKSYDLGVRVGWSFRFLCPAIAVMVGVVLIVSYIVSSGGPCEVPRVRDPSDVGCTTDMDCSLNGVCIKGKCNCTSAWKGEHCHMLNFRPDATANLGYKGAENGYTLSSWGASVHRSNKTGMYHMIASEVAAGAGMVIWMCTSRIIHATSPNPSTTPFTKVRTLFDVFAHEPRCSFSPSGRLVCYFVHNSTLEVTGTCINREGKTDSSCDCKGGRLGNPMPTMMSYIDDIDDYSAPWSTPRVIPAMPVDPDANFAPVILANGSVHALYRSNKGINIQVVTAERWNDTDSYVLGERAFPAWLPEDPFVWLDANNNWHALFHANPHPSGTHAFSRDGWNWQTYWSCQTGNNGFFWLCPTTIGDAYTPSIASDSITAGCRERPSLIFSPDGYTPIGLVTALSPDPMGVTTDGQPSGSCRHEGYDYSYTSVQLLYSGPGMSYSGNGAASPPPPAPAAQLSQAHAIAMLSSKD